MAKTTEVETAVRRSKRFQPLVGPLGSAVVADGSVRWLGEPRHVRETVQHDILEDEREEWDSDGEGETSFYDAFTRPRTGPTVLSVVRDGERSRKGKGKKKEPDIETFSVGDTVLVTTAAAVPSVAVIVSMWETSAATAGMHVKVHWFLRPKELASIRAKRDYVEVSDLVIPTDASC
jgi:origin recognition complex subunit 1